jgi:hypothetical protein
MPGPGPRGPRQTYRAPCSRFRDSRFLARNPRKPGNSRAARGTRTRQPGTRSTRDGLLCGEIASAAGGTRARAARNAPAADRNPAHGPRSSSSSPASSPAIGHQLDERRPFVCQIGIQTPGTASAAERFSLHGSPGRGPRIGSPGTTGRGPGRSGQLPGIADRDRRATRRRPRGCQTGARAMFLTNNPVKNDMNVSRETLPNF